MTTDITELAQRVDRIISEMKLKHGGNDTYAPIMKWDEFLALEKVLEKAQQRIGKLEKKLTDHKRMNQEMAKAMLTPNDSDAAGMEIAALRQRIAELEREQEQLRPVGVMSEQAFHRLENSECRFIALWPRPGIFLPRKRPEDGVIVYARTAAAAGIKVEAE
ncbi:hypothetical protein [Klebsiella pneumoniae]|uniref:hypothetical protein n=1 Tax=Klebsiella pneumoniae TaxID=573 RepID=UPI0010DCD93C|nr:hypothetical protein [Klebsiella pneumoniae]VGA16707.1 Uncharacterised protein [Klebsiella pneumoniae]